MAVQMSEHPVCRNPMLRRQLADNIGLELGERNRIRGYEALLIQRQMRIRRTADQRTGKINLLPIGIGLAPEHGSPRLIQAVQRNVTLLQPFPERGMIRFCVEYIDLAVQLVINLPADDGGMILVGLDHISHDPAAQLSVYRTAVIVMTPHAVSVQHTFHVGIQNFRILMRQPSGRRSGRSPHNDC
ncbi:hypothetical protein D3C71_1286390 [compost metagenome]